MAGLLEAFRGLIASFEPRLVKVKLIYLIQFCANGALGPFIPVYYSSINVPSWQIGVLTGISPFVSFVGAPIWGSISDRFEAHKKVLTVATFVAPLIQFSIGFITNFYLLIFMTLLSAFVTSAIGPLFDNAVLEYLGDQKEHYGKQRLWLWSEGPQHPGLGLRLGAVGYGGMAAITGWLVQRMGNNVHYYFYVYIFFAAITFGFLWTFELKSVRKTTNFWANAKKVMSLPEVIFFFITVFIQGTASGLIYSFLLVYLEKDLGGSHVLLGLSIAATCSTEIIFFFFSDWIFAKITVKGVIYMGIGTMAVRLIGYSFLTDPWWVFPMEFLHGITYAGMWSAGVQYAREVAPKGLGATVQGLLSGVWGGLGVGVGSLISGVLWRNLGPAVTFRLVAVWVFVGFLIFVISDQLLKRYRLIHPLEAETEIEGGGEKPGESLLERDKDELVDLDSDEPKVTSTPLEDGSASKFQSLGLYQDSDSSSSDEAK